MPGSVEAIFITPDASAPMQSVPEVRAIAGEGLEGDRYRAAEGTFSKKPAPAQQATLIEVEAIDAVNRDYEIELRANESRRNILTRGIALNHLVGCDFTIGDARLRGLKLCEPCGHLQRLTRDGVRDALVHRGGLRAEIIESGTIRIGDAIRPMDDGGG